MYDAADRRFVAVDLVRGSVYTPMSLNRYAYCLDNPLRFFDPFGYATEDVTRWFARMIIGNPINNFATKHGLFEDLFRAAGFVRTEDLTGKQIYHATMDCLQQYGGYNSFYDTVFYYATSMDKDFFQFNSGGIEYRLWAWKGDYLNLGAGAEMGIYKQMNVAGYSTPQWLVDPSLSMHMTLQLQYKGNTIINWDPVKDNDYDWNKVWWVTGFNPYVTNVNANDLKAIYTVTFNNQTMYIDFYNKFGCKGSDYYDPRWTGWDDKNYSVAFNF